jgi:Protein of unknown function (DUF1036)
VTSTSSLLKYLYLSQRLNTSLDKSKEMVMNTKQSLNIRSLFSVIVTFFFFIASVGMTQSTDELNLRQLEQSRDQYINQRNGLYIEFALLAASYPRATVAVMARNAGLMSTLKGFIEQEIPTWAIIATAIGAGFCLDSAESIYNCSIASEKLYDLARRFDVIQKQIESINTYTGYKLQLSNECSYPIELAVKYQDVNGNWQTVGWWNFDAEDKAFLLLSNSPVRLKNPNIYFFAKTNTGMTWSGDYTVTYDNQALNMRAFQLPLTDDYHYEISVICQ